MACNKENSTEAIIEKWYKILEFPKEFDDEFYNALGEIKIPESVSVKNYDMEETDGKKNLLSFLYMCEELKKRYEDKGISTEILYDTVKDIVRWTKTWTKIKGTLYLGEIYWLARHLDMRIFRLGRLQFCEGEIPEDICCDGLSKGDKMIEIHIPSGGPIKREDCEKSIEMAKEFYKKYYPDYDYKCFTCHSWLLDTSLEELLDEESNIVKFQKMFCILKREKSDELFKYVFAWNVKREDLGKVAPTSTFSEKVKKRALEGKDFYEAFGILNK